MRTAIAILFLASVAAAHEVPSSVQMPNGETMYVTGHQCSDTSVQSGDPQNILNVLQIISSYF